MLGRRAPNGGDLDREAQPSGLQGERLQLESSHTGENGVLGLARG